VTNSTKHGGKEQVQNTPAPLNGTPAGEERKIPIRNRRKSVEERKTDGTSGKGRKSSFENQEKIEKQDRKSLNHDVEKARDHSAKKKAANGENQKKGGAFWGYRGERPPGHSL